MSQGQVRGGEAAAQDLPWHDSGGGRHRRAGNRTDWDIAGLILEHSDRTVALALRMLSTERPRDFEARGQNDEIREAARRPTPRLH
jgi:hypothetical protein